MGIRGWGKEDALLPAKGFSPVFRLLFGACLLFDDWS